MNDKKIIYHYTSSEAAKSILSTNKIRFTDALNTNDASEMVYGIEKLIRFIKKGELSEVSKFHGQEYIDLIKSDPSIKAEDILNKIKTAMPLLGPERRFRNQFMLFSCTKRHEDVAMFDRYASNHTGVSLGFLRQKINTLQYSFDINGFRKALQEEFPTVHGEPGEIFFKDIEKQYYRIITEQGHLVNSCQDICYDEDKLAGFNNGTICAVLIENKANHWWSEQEVRLFSMLMIPTEIELDLIVFLYPMQLTEREREEHIEIKKRVNRLIKEHSPYFFGQFQKESLASITIGSKCKEEKPFWEGLLRESGYDISNIEIKKSQIKVR